jgi:phage terminase large subunit-like protein
MFSRKTFLITTAIVLVLAIPTVAWALTAPSSTDLPTESGSDESYDWMDQMHDYMWNGEQPPEGFPADGDWMNEMHGYMWSDEHDGNWMGHMHGHMWDDEHWHDGFPADSDWMNQMHDYMWGDGQAPEGFPSGLSPMGTGRWGNP